MKNIKEVLKFLLIIAIIIPFCSFVLVKADSGWDSDSGSSFGGSSFGGSSWSSSSSSGGSSGDLSDIKPYQSIIMSLFISGHMYVFFLGPVGDYLDKKNSKIKHKPLLIAARLISVVIIEIIYPLFVLFDFFGVFVLCFIGTLIKIGTESAKPVFGSSAKDVDEAIIQELLPDESIGSLKAKLFDVFTDVQIAWMNFEYDKLKTLCGDELATSYIQELEVLKLKNGQNVMHDFEIDSCQIVRVEKVPNGTIIEAHMTATFYDYVIDTTTNKVIRGSDKRRITTSYKLEFMRGNSSKVKCPKCGGEFDANGNVSACPYCRTQLSIPSSIYRLIQKGRL